MRFLALLIFAAALSAQTAQVSGLVTDSSGAVLPGASIVLTKDDTGTRRTSRANGEGWYTIPATQPGIYKIRAGHAGFQPVVQFGLVVRAGERLRVDFTLRLGPVEDSVTVTSDATPLGGEDTGLGMIVGRDMIDRLPLTGRGLAALLELVPGVVITPAGSTESGQFSANGSRSGSNYVTVDGVSANAGIQLIGLPGSPAVRQTLGGAIPTYTAVGTMQSLALPETVEEFRLQTSGTRAESGRTSGAQLALITRAGTNQFHASFYHYFRNEALDANNWFANQSSQPRGRVRLRDSGITAGGPILRNRTFFFGSSETLDLSHSLVDTRYLPTLESRLTAPPAVSWLTRALPLPNGPQISQSQAIYFANAPRSSYANAFTSRIDHMFGASAQIFGRFSHTPSADTKEYPGALAESKLSLASNSFTIGLDHVVGPATYNSIRINYTSVDEDWLVSPRGDVDLRRVAPALPLPADTSYGLSVISLGLSLGYDRASAAQRQWNLVETLGLTRGSHTFQLGADARSLAPRLGSAPYFVQNTYSNLETLALGNIFVTTVHQRNPARFRISNLSAFAQDVWRLSPRLTLSYGLRWEFNPPPASIGDAPRFASVVFGEMPSLTLAPQGSTLWTRSGGFAPRAGVAYQLLPSGRLVVRGSAGIHYDLGFGPALEAAVAESIATVVGANAGNAIPTPLNFYDGGSANLATLSKIVSGFTAPYIVQWNATLESQIARSLLASVSYAGAAGLRLLRNELILLPETGLTNVYTNGGTSSYNALQLQARSRLAKWLDGIASFTWGHSIDTGSRDGDLFSQAAQWPGSIDRGSSSFDIRRSFSAVLTADLPEPSLALLRGPVFRGWSLAGIFRARTGFPITVNGLTGFFPRGEESRPDFVASQPLWIPDSGVAGGRRLNPAAFQMPTDIRQGILGRNSIPGLGMAQLDLAVEKKIYLREQIEARLRIEAFNVSNHPNFGNPESFLGSPSFGRPMSMVDRFLGAGGPSSGLAPALQIGGPRSLQIALRLRF